MKRLVLSFLLLVPFLMTVSSTASAQAEIEPWPEATAEMAGVGEAGPRLDTGGHILSTSEFISAVVQDASVTWTSVFAAAGRSWVPPTVVMVEAGSYARSSCGINIGDPAEDAYLTPMLYCQYGGETGVQRLEYSEVLETRYIYSPVVYVSIPWVEGFARASGAPADMAIAYRVMHEYSHHVARALGITDHRGDATGGLTGAQAELATECLSGVWAWSTFDQGQLDTTDVEAVQRTAWGEDALRMEEFGREGEYGTAAEQLDAFMVGYAGGNPGACLAAAAGG